MERKVILADPNKCTGCRVCELACSLKHEGVFAPSLSRIRIVKIEEIGINNPISCLDCSKMLCVEACPTGANQPMKVDRRLCLGCRECVAACPFGAMDYNPVERVAFKCDLCGGDPECVKYCIPGALSFGLATVQAKAKRRERTKIRYGMAVGV
jgi:carbon-monoxide dehydrogenase iron sulfur subunit